MNRRKRLIDFFALGLLFSVALVVLFLNNDKRSIKENISNPGPVWLKSQFYKIDFKLIKGDKIWFLMKRNAINIFYSDALM